MEKNKKEKIIRKVLLLSAILFLGMLCLPSSNAEASVGISPVEYNYDFLLPNQLVTDVVYFTRKEATPNEKFIVSADGEGSEAIKFLDGEEITLPGGEHTSRYRFGINTGSLPEGTYEPRLHIHEVSPDTESSGAGLVTLSGAKAIVRFTVVNNEIEKCSVDAAKFGIAEEGSPLPFEYRVVNGGNVDTRPKRIELTLRDKFDPNNIERITLDADELEVAPPFTKNFYNIEIENERQSSVYDARAIFFCDENKASYILNQEVEIFEEGTFEQIGNLLDFDTDKEEYLENELVSINAKFKNEGSIAYKAELNIEIYENDQKVEVIKSEPVRVRAGEEIEFNETYRPPKSGDYSARGFVEFGSNQTDQKEAPFKVITANSFVLILFIVGLAGLLGLILFLAYKKRKKGLEVLRVSFVDLGPEKPIKITYLIKNNSLKDEKLGMIELRVQDPDSGEVLWREAVEEELREVPGRKEVVSELVSENNMPKQKARIIVSFLNKEKEYIFVEDEIFVKEVRLEE